MKFEEYIERWKKSARTKTSESWKLGQDQVLAAHIFPHLSSKQLGKIKPEDISLVMTASKAKGHSPNTQKKIYMVLSKVFSDAIEFFEYLDKSPVKKRFHLPEVPTVERGYMTFEQSLIFLEYSMHHVLFSEAAWIMTLTSIRISEMQALEWADINFKESKIDVRRSYCKWTRTIRPYTKNKTIYSVPMPPMLYAFLWNRKRSKGLIGKNMVGGMMNRDSFRSFLKIASKNLKLPVKGSHSLRHTCARIYVEKGARDEEIKELLGHRSLASSKTYTHRNDLKILKDLSKKIA